MIGGITQKSSTKYDRNPPFLAHFSIPSSAPFSSFQIAETPALKRGVVVGHVIMRQRRNVIRPEPDIFDPSAAAALDILFKRRETI